MTPTAEQRLRMRNQPKANPLLLQTWENLLFAHWECDPAALQKTLPPQLKVDTFHGRAYVGVVPFYARDTRLQFTPPLPMVSDFWELNVRTYVHDHTGAPGVWFYSLDCSQALAVAGARAAFSLPYYSAAIGAAETMGASVRYHCLRDGTSETSEFRWTVGDLTGEAASETLDFFLIERYLLFSRSAQGRLYSARVWHQPYSLHKCALGRWDDVMLQINGLGRFPNPPSHVVFSKGVKTRIFAPKALASQDPIV